jgi:5'(3')-deoxyribonucleotidase
LVDCDGVLADFVTPVVAWAGPDFTRDSISEFDILKAWGIEDRQDELDRHCAQPGWCEALPVYEGAREFVDRLRSRFEVVIVTSPYSNVPTWTSERIAWLRKHFGIPKQDVVFCERKNLVRGAALVDDAIHNLEDFDGHRILIDQPWNRASRSLNWLRCPSLTIAAATLEGLFSDAGSKALSAGRLAP